MTPPWRWTVALEPGNFARPNSRSSTKLTGPGRTTAATSTQSLGKPTLGGDSAPGTVPTKPTRRRTKPTRRRTTKPTRRRTKLTKRRTTPTRRTQDPLLARTQESEETLPRVS